VSSTLSSATVSVTRVCSVCKASYVQSQGHACPLGESVPATNDTQLEGAILGERYRIARAISKGGMGVVFKAHHTVLDKPLAVKVMLQPQDEAARRRFLQEAKLASQVAHPNIIDIVDFGVLTTDQPFLVMEWLSGQTLADLIAEGPLPFARACTIAAQIARGLHAVHQRGIIHRDLKPANIFVLPQDGGFDLVKIVDFGIATQVADGDGSRPAPARLTSPGMVLGTAEYMSPEQAQGMRTDHRVDQYALGCILFEMLTGHVPFEGPTPAATMLMHLTKQPVPPSKDRPNLGIPRELDAIVLKAMAMEVADRYPSMKELEDALVALIGEMTGLTTSAILPAVGRSSLSRSAQRVGGAAPAPSLHLLRWHKVVLVGLVAALTALGTLLVRWRYDRPEPSPRPTVATPAPPEPPRVRRVVWDIQSRPPGAAVLLVPGQTQLGTTPWRTEHTAEAKTVEVELRLAGHRPRRIQLDRSVDEHRVEALDRERPQSGGKKPKGSAGKARTGREPASGSYTDNDSLKVID
jgi:predicted Ser/Thr protein kinase